MQQALCQPLERAAGIARMQLPVRSQVVDDLGQQCREVLRDIRRLQARALCDLVEDPGVAERALNLAGRYREVLAATDPGLKQVPEATALESLHEAPQAVGGPAVLLQHREHF